MISFVLTFSVTYPYPSTSSDVAALKTGINFTLNVIIFRTVLIAVLHKTQEYEKNQGRHRRYDVV